MAKAKHFQSKSKTLSKRKQNTFKAKANHFQSESKTLSKQKRNPRGAHALPPRPQIHAKRRILLTGTPLQNSLLELMSLLAFIMPKLFEDKLDVLKRIFLRK